MTDEEVRNLQPGDIVSFENDSDKTRWYATITRIIGGGVDGYVHMYVLIDNATRSPIYKIGFKTERSLDVLKGLAVFHGNGL